MPSVCENRDSGNTEATDASTTSKDTERSHDGPSSAIPQRPTPVQRDDSACYPPAETTAERAEPGGDSHITG